MEASTEKPGSPASLSTHRKRRPPAPPIDELAINGPEAELVDVVDGRRFLYHFEQDNLTLDEIVRQGCQRFQQRYGQPPSVIILAASYGLGSGQRIAGLKAVSVQDLPWYHFWFGPKPNFYQLTLDF